MILLKVKGESDTFLTCSFVSITIPYGDSFITTDSISINEMSSSPYSLLKYASQVSFDKLFRNFMLILYIN